MKNYQQLATFTYPADLAIARSLLESMNIECYVKDELTVQVHNFYSNAIGGISLEIPKDSFNAARSALIEGGFESNLIEINEGVLEENNKTNTGFMKFLKISIGFVVIASVLLMIVISWLLFYE